ncbi:hypothetical protein CYY_001146 [Polysphondylium violaceum]|uniref:Cytoplasmic dynein intermediate chain n=1 Tax=Polysphondylium violaceum TaxID=133409 RepID=A0A8J4Q098_9MYCE|nr:hypothetical protein CYY_001146 [Polysphondylium violaceum]
MDTEAMKNQRKKELEEMKKRLAEIKEKNKNSKAAATTKPTISSPSTTDAPAGTSSPPTTGMDFDSFIDSVNQIVPTPTSPTTAAADSTTTTTASTTGSTGAGGYRAVLSIHTMVSEIDIPPKETIMYTKTSQTVDLDSAVNTASSGTNEDHHQTPNKNNKNKYHMHTLTTSQENATSTNNTESPPTNTATTNTSTEQTDDNDKDQDDVVIPELDDFEKQNILDSDAFKSFFTKSSKVIERALYLDDSVDILVDYTLSDDSKSKSSGKELKLVATLADERWTKHRSVTDINWSPKHPELVVSSYSANEAGSHDPDGVVLVWSVNNYFQKPEYVFNCQSPVMTTFFSKFHPTLIVGGTYSGQIVIWDTRAKSTPVQRTPLSSVGHTHPVYSMAVVGSANANSLVSISTDAKLCSWNLENLLQPIETIELNNTKNTSSSGTGSGTGASSSVSGAGSSIAVTSLIFPENELSQFYIGTEEGVVCQASRHGSKIVMNERYKGHFGPITSVDLHPSKGNVDFSQYFISSSTDWTVKLWSTKKEAPIYSFEDYVDYVYDARWSPVHPSVFATGDGSGLLSLWDLNQDLESPIFRHKVSQRSVNRLSWSHDGKKLLVGDSGGSLSLFDSTEFSSPTSEEWNQFEDVIDKMVSKSHSQDSPLLGSNETDGMANLSISDQ